jgi:hypothetical protein
MKQTASSDPARLLSHPNKKTTGLKSGRFTTEYYLLD